jgi:hypothetical protein
MPTKVLDERLSETLNQIQNLATIYPACFNTVLHTALKDSLTSVLKSDPYFNLDEISEDISLGGIQAFSRLMQTDQEHSSEMNLRHLKRFLLLVHRILGYHSSAQTRRFKLQILSLNENQTQDELKAQLRISADLRNGGLHNWLIKTLPGDQGSLVEYYKQGEDERALSFTLTKDGWCLGVSVQWIKFKANNRADFWKWMKTDEGAAAFRFVMAGQNIRKESQTEKMSDRAAFALKSYGILPGDKLECPLPAVATPEAMAKNIINAAHNLRRIGQDFVGGGGHSTAAYKGNSYSFMDPNAGEFMFTDPTGLISWLPKFVRIMGYEFKSHYVEVYTGPSAKVNTLPPKETQVKSELELALEKRLAKEKQHQTL